MAVGQFNAQGGAEDARYRADIERMYRALGVGNESDIAKMIQGGKMYGSSGLLDLYQARPGELSMYDENLLRGAGIFGDQNLRYQELVKGKGMGSVPWGSIASGLASAFGGFGGADPQKSNDELFQNGQLIDKDGNLIPIPRRGADTSQGTSLDSWRYGSNYPRYGNF